MKLKHLPIGICLAASPFLLSACVTPAAGMKMAESLSNSVDKRVNGITKTACSTKDWDAKGYTDATSDTKRGLAPVYQSTCNEYGLAFDGIAYETGYNRGIEDHCTFALGEKRKKSIFDMATPCTEVETYMAGYKSDFLVSGDDLIEGSGRWPLVSNVNRYADALNLKAEFLRERGTQYGVLQDVPKMEYRDLYMKYNAALEDLRDYEAANNLDPINPDKLVQLDPIK